MDFLPGGLYHVFNQGNNKKPIFYGRDNYIYFIKKMENHLKDHCDILAWCLMPNHFHWLIRVHEDYICEFDKIESNKTVLPINRSISTLLSSYTKAINKSRRKTGSLFRSRTKAIQLNSDDQVSDNYPLICFLYIHQNPLRAGLVNSLDSWIFSSFRDYAGIRKGTLCNVKLGRELFELPATDKEFILFSNQTIPEDYIDGFS